jgi:hypothetical protein
MKPNSAARYLALLFSLFSGGSALAGSWETLGTFQDGKNQLVISVNTDTFRFRGDIASILIEQKDLHLGSSREVEMSTFRWYANCLNWKFKRDGDNSWRSAKRGYYQDDINSYLCSKARAASRPAGGGSSSESPTVNVQIKPPSALDVIKQRMINNMLSQMGW